NFSDFPAATVETVRFFATFLTSPAASEAGPPAANGSVRSRPPAACGEETMESGTGTAATRLAPPTERSSSRMAKVVGKNKSLTKSEIATQLAEKVGISKKQAVQFL